MQSVLISIKPQWCAKIANGEKTIEVRKSRPKLETPFKCYIYQTKPKDRLITILKDGDENYGEIYHGKPVFIKTYGDGYWTGRNQKVIGEFVCDRIDMLAPLNHCDADVEKESCLTREQIVRYLNGKGYGWHISALQIYDKPRELSEFYHYLPDKILYNGDYDCRGGGEIVCMDMPEGGSDCEECPYGGRVYLKRPPESWRYVEDLDAK